MSVVSLHTEIKQALVRSLRLPMAPEEIGDSTPLFGPDGLGLDSIDVLELVLELERIVWRDHRESGDRHAGVAVGRFHRRLHPGKAGERGFFNLLTP